VSDTPETDKQSWWNHSAGKIELCPADFAKKLERERDALRNELNFTIRLSRTWEDDVKNISADRDYWKAEAERWRAIR